MASKMEGMHSFLVFKENGTLQQESYVKKNTIKRFLFFIIIKDLDKNVQHIPEALADHMIE